MNEMNTAVQPNSASNPTIMQNPNGFELLDFFDGTNDLNLDLVSLIRGERFPNFDNHVCSSNCITTTHDHDQGQDHHDQLINGFLVGDRDHQFGPDTTGLLNDIALPGSFDGQEVINLGNHDQDEELEEDDDDDDDENGDNGQSSESAKSKRDRSKTLVSERKRRGRMKEKLYALRSLVPNITKMDKASIVGDAVRYVTELQTQANMLRDEIEGLEASYQASSTNNNFNNNAFNFKFHQPIPKNILQMEIFQVEDRGFYMKIVCNKGDGIARSLYKVVESLTSLNAQTSNLASTPHTIEFIVTLRVIDSVREISLPDLKLWVIGALFNEGFELKQITFP